MTMIQYQKGLSGILGFVILLEPPVVGEPMEELEVRCTTVKKDGVISVHEEL